MKNKNTFFISQIKTTMLFEKRIHRQMDPFLHQTVNRISNIFFLLRSDESANTDVLCREKCTYELMP